MSASAYLSWGIIIHGHVCTGGRTSLQHSLPLPHTAPTRVRAEDSQSAALSSSGCDYMQEVNGSAGCAPEPCDRMSCPSTDHASKTPSWLAIPSAARQEWSQVHVRPATACLTCMISLLLGHGTAFAGYLAGSSWFTWHAHLTALSNIAVLPIIMSGIWHHGPAINKSPVFILVMLVHHGMAFTASAIIWSGPIHYYMFRSRLITFLVFFVASFFQLLAGAVAPAPSAYPEKPLTSLAGPVLYAGDITMRFMNAITDLSIVRIILDQARGSCYWYGRRISCAQYKWQAYAVGACAGAHFCSTLLRSLNTRWTFAAVSVASVAELGIVAVTLLKLGCDSRHPDIAADSAAARRLRSDAAFTVVSSVLSVSAVVLDVVGFRKLLTVANRVAASVRRISNVATLGRAAQSSRRSSACGAADAIVCSVDRAAPGDAAIVSVNHG